MLVRALVSTGVPSVATSTLASRCCALSTFCWAWVRSPCLPASTSGTSSPPWALTTWTVAPKARASTPARSTARSAVSEPSVPTTIDSLLASRFLSRSPAPPLGQERPGRVSISPRPYRATSAWWRLLRLLALLSLWLRRLAPTGRSGRRRRLELQKKKALPDSQALGLHVGPNPPLPTGEISTCVRVLARPQAGATQAEDR